MPTKFRPSELSAEQIADAERLRALVAAWKKAGGSRAQRRTTKLLATKYFKHQTQGTVWQYLHAKRPLNEEAALVFASALKVPLSDISPSLARAFNAKVVASRISAKNRGTGSPAEPNVVHTPLTEQQATIRGIATMTAHATWHWLDMLPAEGAVPWNRPGCYALRVMGDAMHPRYKSGEYLIVREGAPIDADTDVLVVMKDGTAMIRELASIRDGRVALSGPAGERLTVEQSKIDFIHRIVGRSDASEVVT